MYLTYGVVREFSSVCGWNRISPKLVIIAALMSERLNESYKYLCFSKRCLFTHVADGLLITLASYILTGIACC